MLILNKGDDEVHRPDGRKGGDGEEAVEVKPEGREAGAGGIQMGGGLWCKEAKPAFRRNIRFAKAPVIPQVIVAGKEGDAPREANSIKVQKGANLGRAGLREKFLGHMAARVGSPILRPGCMDITGDCGTGGGHRAQREVRRFRS